MSAKNNQSLVILAGLGAMVLLAGNKKKSGTEPSTTEEDTGQEDTGQEDTASDTEEEDSSGEGSSEGEEISYGKVASGSREDLTGKHYWKISRKEDGFHAHLLEYRRGPVREDIGVSSSEDSARAMIRDHLNEKLLAAGHQESDFMDDPVESQTQTASLFAV